MASLVSWIRAAELEFGHCLAVVDGERRLTFAQVADRSNRAAQVLCASTSRRSVNVALLVGNAGEAVELDIAAIKAGLGRVSLNPRLTNDERSYIVTDSQAQVLVYDPEYADFAEQCRARNTDLVLFETGEGPHRIGPGAGYEDALAQAPSSRPDVVQAGDTPSLIMYTSGTTGRPKGAVWTLSSRAAGVTNMLLNELDRAAAVGMVHAASVSHGSGSKIVPVYLRGGVNILMRKFDPAEFFRLVEAEGASASFMVPSMVQSLVDESLASGALMESMVQITYGGAKMPLPTIQSALARFGKVFAQVYGSCEAPHPVLILPRHEHDSDEHVLSTAGRRSLGTTLRFGDTSVEPEAGAVGELLIGGEHVFGGYWNDPEATETVFTDGFFRTGDIAQLHEGGYVEIVGRVKEMIISGGFNVYPAEVERVLLEHPGVSGACVYGLPDERWGEAVFAAVTVEAGRVIDTAEIIATCRDRLANYKVPKQIWITDSFPLGSTGKVQRSEVARLHPVLTSEN